MLRSRERKPLADTIEWVKVSSAAWKGDGFYYSRYPEPPPARSFARRTSTTGSSFIALARRRRRTSSSSRTRARPSASIRIDTTEDERFAILDVADRGPGKKGNALFVRDLREGGASFMPLMPAITDDSFDVVDDVGDAAAGLDRQGRAERTGRAASTRSTGGSELEDDPAGEPPSRSTGVDRAGGKLFADLHEGCHDARRSTPWTASSSTR